MDLPPKTVYEILSSKGVESIFHANSVLTSCQFIRQKSLLSRGNAERLNLSQTPQVSDEIDKRYSIWFDVFTDSVDIHHRAKNINHYGPVLFEFSSELVKRAYTGRIWVTKLNPTKWAGVPRSKRWFQSKDDLDKNYIKGNFDQMIVFRHCGGALSFGNFLRKITVDDPKMQVEGVDLFSVGFGALALAMSDAGLSLPIKRRRCGPQCRCKAKYSESEGRTARMFTPYV